MSNVYATQAIAEAHIAELHRVAARRRIATEQRRALDASGRATAGVAAAHQAWAHVRRALAVWVSAPAAKAAEPACCPA